MDHRKICPERPRHKFFAHRTMGIQSDFKNNRSKNDGHRRGKHSRRSGSLCRKSSKLLRHSPDIQPMQTSHRICRKKEMEKYLTLTTWMRRLYCLFLDRSDPKQGLKTILTAIDYIKRGISICIFPEGTRNTGAELSLLPFKDGAFKIATKTGCPIVPICMNNTAEIFENHFPKIRKTHVVIEYQKPIYPDRLDKETKRHIGDHVESIIKETIEKNAKLYF